MKCEEATRLVSLSCEQKLEFKKKLKVYCHLLICSYCRNFQQNNEKISKLMKQFAQKEDE